MLVLSRKVGEQVVIPACELTVRVVAVKGKTVRLAITAPPEIDVWREELLHREHVAFTTTVPVDGV